MNWAYRVTVSLSFVTLSQVGAFAQSSSLQMSVDPLPRFSFSLRIDLGGPRTRGFEPRTLDDLFHNRSDYWNTLFWQPHSYSVAGGVKDLTSLSTLQADALLRSPGLIETIQRDAANPRTAVP